MKAPRDGERKVTRPQDGSVLQDLLRLGLQRLVEFALALLEGLVDQVVRLLELVLGQVAVLLHLLGLLVGVAALVAQRDPVLLDEVLDLGDELLALLPGQRRHQQVERLAVALWVQAEVGLEDGLLDVPHHVRRGVERLDGQLPRLGHRDVGDLVERRRSAVVLDAEGVDERRRRAAGADRAELVAQVVDDDEVMLITDGGKVLRARVAGISTMGRATQGVRLMKLRDKDSVASFTLM